MKKYKVLTQKDKWFSSKFDPEMLEQAINSYCEQGWRVITCTSANFHNNNRNEIIVIFERDE